MKIPLLILALLVLPSTGFQSQAPVTILHRGGYHRQHQQHDESGSCCLMATKSSRRSLFNAAAALLPSWLIVSTPDAAHAGIDPSLLKTLPVQGDESGAAQRLRQVDAIQRPTTDLEDKPFETLPSGVSYREYRAGKGEAGA